MTVLVLKRIDVANAPFLSGLHEQQPELGVKKIMVAK